MKFEIFDEGVVWKNPYPGSILSVALYGFSIGIGGGKVLHVFQEGPTRTGADAIDGWHTQGSHNPSRRF